MEKKDKKIKNLVIKIKENLINNYGRSIKQVILYGSYVRGEATKESDIDILVLVDTSLNSFDVRRSVSDLLYDILLNENELISVTVVSENFYNKYNSPFILNVKKEGIIT